MIEPNKKEETGGASVIAGQIAATSGELVQEVPQEATADMIIRQKGTLFPNNTIGQQGGKYYAYNAEG